MCTVTNPQVAAEMVDAAFAEGLRQKIMDDKIYPNFTYYGLLPDDHGTAHLSVLAPNGDAVSVTSTINYRCEHFTVNVWMLQEIFHNWENYEHLTLSLLRVICSLSRYTTSHSMKNLALHSLLRWKIIILAILATSLIHFLFKMLGERSFWA